MAAQTIIYQAPIAQVPASIGSVPVYGGPASSHINAEDFCQLVTGNLVPALVGATTNLVGIAQHDSTEVFDQVDTDPQGVFGTTQISATAGLMPYSPHFVLVSTIGPPVIIEMSLSASYAWQTASSLAALTANIGTRVGLNVVGGTGGIGAFSGNTNFYYADPAQAAFGTIVGKVFGPFKGVAGDVGVRVLVAVDTAALAVVQGH